MTGLGTARTDVLVVVAAAGASGLLEVDAERSAIKEKEGTVAPTGGDCVQVVPRGGRCALDDLVGVAAQADGAGRQTAFVCASPKTLPLAWIIPVSTIATVLTTGRGSGPPTSVIGCPSGLIATRRGAGSRSLIATHLLVESV